jgi:amidase
MRIRRLYKTSALVLLVALLLTACNPSAIAPTAVPATPIPTAAAEPTPAPATQEPTTTPAPTSAAEPNASTDTNILDALYQRNADRFQSILLACPQRTYPIPDPAVSVKRPLDFGPFSSALLNVSPEQAAALDAAVAGKSIPEIQALMAGGQLSSEQLVLHYLARIQRYDEGRLNSVMELNPAALMIAQELDAERAAGAVRGPLHGIPVLIKDNIATGDGMHTTAGNYALKDWQATRDAFLVQQLREAGAVILGKNNLSEWANYTDPCTPNGFSALGGQTRNPHGPYDTLGSSSGSAVSVAAGLATVSVGSETAGSLVQPARANGVVGMRPSKGLISGDYIIPLEPSLDTAGPMGRSVTDVAVLLTALAAASPDDPRATDAAPLAGADFTQYLSLDEARNVRVGVVQLDRIALATLGDTFKNATPEEQAQLLEVIQPPLLGASATVVAALERQGIEVVLIKESELPPLNFAPQGALISYGFRNGINQFFGGLAVPAPIRSLDEVVATVNADPASRAPYGQRLVEASAASEVTSEQYAAAVRETRRLAEEWLAAVLPTYGVDVLMYGLFYNGLGPAGVPAINIPTGRSAGSQEPSGVIITGPRLSDHQLIAVGYALEQALDVQLEPDLETTIAQIDAVRPAPPLGVPPPTEELVRLRANPWQWRSYSGPTEEFAVENPAGYQLTFNSDATLAITADCNQAAGSYQGEGGKLTIELGPVTAAACPEGSRSEQFLALLGGAALYRFDGNDLIIELMADGGTLTFVAAP